MRAQISRAIAFENLLADGRRFSERLLGAFSDARTWPQLVHIATDGETYGGSNVGNLGGLEAEAVEWQGRTHSIVINLPPLAVVAFKREAGPAGDSAVETPNEAKATS